VSAEPASLVRICLGCGEPLDTPTRNYCEACRRAIRVETLQAVRLEAGLLPAPVEIVRTEPAPDVPARPRVPWAEHLRQWTTFLMVDGYSPKTVTEYRSAIVRFMADTLLDLDHLTEEDVVAYLSGLTARGRGRKLALAGLKSYGAWAAARGVGPNAAARIRFPKVKYGPAPDLTDSDLTRLVVAAAWHSPRWAWAVLFIYGTGCRIGSAIAVRPEDVRLFDVQDETGARVPGGTVYFRVAKNDDPYSVPLVEPALTAARELIEHGHPTLLGAGEGRVREWVTESARRADLHVWPHLLRHAFSTRVAQATDPKTWMTLMNHHDLKQFDRYVATDDERKRSALRNALG
jgi:integrase